MSGEIDFKTEELYIAQWKRNRLCCETVGEKHSDWLVTVCFYTALHAVNAAIAHLKQKVHSHESRNDLVKQRSEFTPLRYNYLKLYRYSRFARYDPDSDAWLPPELTTPADIFPMLLYPVERGVESIVGPQKLRDLKFKK